MTARTLPEAMRDNRILHWNFCFSCAFSSMRGEDLNWKWPAPTPPSSRTVAAHRPEPARLGVHRVKGAEGSARSECIIMFDCIPKVQKKIEKGEPTTPSSLLPPRPMMRTASGLFFCPIARKNLLPLPRNLNAAWRRPQSSSSERAASCASRSAFLAARAFLRASLFSAPGHPVSTPL